MIAFLLPNVVIWHGGALTLGALLVEFKSQLGRFFVSIEKKSLINNLKTTKKAIVASTPTDARVSAKVLPRKNSRVIAKLQGPVKSRISRISGRA
jgi:hypothetical protein